MKGIAIGIFLILIGCAGVWHEVATTFKKATHCGTITHKHEAPKYYKGGSSSGDPIFIIKFPEKYYEIHPTYKDFLMHKVGDPICYDISDVRFYPERDNHGLVCILFLVLLVAGIVIWILSAETGKNEKVYNI